MVDETVRIEERFEQFRRDYQSDSERGRVRSLSDYLERYPDVATRVRDDYLTQELSRSGVETREVSAPPGLERLGPYELIRQLGRGGQGTVHLARDTRLGRLVALKVLETGLDAALFARFEREAQAASRLDEPGICAVYDVGTDESRSWIAMAYIQGQTLGQWIDRRWTTADEAADGSDPTWTAVRSGDAASAASGSRTRTSPTTGRGDAHEFVGIVARVARSLHVAHEAGVVHRDIKPANIMIDGQGRPVILDFGLARIDEAEMVSLTYTGAILGTPLYMAPEQVSGRPVDRRTDVYALGVTLYEGLTGRRPFQAPTREALFQAILTEVPERTRRVNPSVSRDLATVVAIALEKRPDARFSTAAALAEDLERVLERRPILAKAPGVVTRVIRWVHRNPLVTALVAAVILSLAAGLAGVASKNRDLTEQKDEAELQRGRAERALADFRLLADLDLVDAARQQADDLWPANAATAPRMSRWLDDVGALVARTEAYRIEMRALEAEAAPTVEADWRRELPEDFRQLDQLTAAVAELEDRVGGAPPDERLSAELDRLEEQALDVERRIGRDRTPVRFPDLDRFARYRLLRRMALVVAQISDPEQGLLREVRERLDFARSVREQTVLRHARAWSDAAAAVARDGHFAFALTPQPGLVPLGPDPVSGLQEFALLQTGAVPNRDESGALETRDDGAVVLVLLPGGSFAMGADAESASGGPVDALANRREGPRHDVTLAPFFLAKTETTQAQWERIVRSNPSRWPTRTDSWRRHPVESVSWHEAQTFARRLDLVLPTEAQWEYAARADEISRWWPGDEVDDLDGFENLADRSAAAANVDWKTIEVGLDDGFAYHAPVASLEANGFGLFDMLGNVRELCQDWYGLYPTSPPRAETGERRRIPEATYRSVRGGSFGSSAQDARSTHRGKVDGAAKSWDVGFRLARPLAP